MHWEKGDETWTLGMTRETLTLIVTIYDFQKIIQLSLDWENMTNDLKRWWWQEARKKRKLNYPSKMTFMPFHVTTIANGSGWEMEIWTFDTWMVGLFVLSNIGWE